MRTITAVIALLFPEQTILSILLDCQPSSYYQVDKAHDQSRSLNEFLIELRIRVSNAKQFENSIISASLKAAN